MVLHFLFVGRETNTSFAVRKSQISIRRLLQMKRKIEKFRNEIIYCIINLGLPISTTYNVLQRQYTNFPSRSSYYSYIKENGFSLIKRDSLRLIDLKIIGLEAQIDWKEPITIHDVSGKPCTFYIFSYVLSYSKKVYYELCTKTDSNTIINCLLNAFKATGGIPKYIVTDNMQHLVVGRTHSHNCNTFKNSNYIQPMQCLARELGFQFITCSYNHPQSKGIVENKNKHLSSLREIDFCYTTTDDLEKWLYDVTKIADSNINYVDYEKERAALQPFKNINRKSYLFMKRKVANNLLIRCRNKRYSVPIHYVGSYVFVFSTNDRVYIYNTSYQLLNVHLITQKNITYTYQDYSDLVYSRATNKKQINCLLTKNRSLYETPTDVDKA